jgi:hypothetical protein
MSVGEALLGKLSIINIRIVIDTIIIIWMEIPEK